MLCFSNSFSSACTKCCVFPIPFLPSQFPSRIPYVFPRKVRCRLFSFKKENIFVFSLKKVCNALSLEKHRESAKGTGKGTGRELGKRKGTGKTQHFVHAEEKELEKHSIFDHTRERELEKHGIFNRAGKGTGKTQHFQSRPGKGTTTTTRTTRTRTRTSR